MTQLRIDNRETALKDLLCSKPEVSFENLDIGDAIIQSESIEVLFERKTVPDLIASIKDGRYNEQKVRLKAWLQQSTGKRTVIYIIEGFTGYNALKKKGIVYGFSSAGIVSALVGLSLRDGFLLSTTKDPEDTACYISEIFDRIVKDPMKYVEGNTSGGGYLETLKMKKNKNITPENVIVLQLSQIPGVSIKTAEAIAVKHSTMAELIRHLDSLEAKSNYIAELTVGTRRIGSKTAEKIVSHLFPQ
jgi:ERCC4-type nuclease